MENVTMASHPIPLEEWARFFDRFSQDHHGTSATLEARGPAVGDQLVARDQIFRSVSADQKDGENRIEIMMGTPKDDSTAHAVMEPKWVCLNDAQGLSGETLEIGCAEDVTMLLHFAP
jgi:hypothetical protein